MTSPLLSSGPYKSIASGVARHLATARDRRDPLAIWGEEVIVASSGVAQSVTAEMLQHFPAGFAALRLQSIESFALRVVNTAGEFPRIATDEERRLAMRTATRSLDDPLTSTRGAAGMLERSYRDVRDNGMTTGEFARRVTNARSLRNRERIRLAIRAWQLYEKLIAKLGAADIADVLARAADLILAGADIRPQIVAGFYDMTGAQSSVLAALRAVEKVSAEFVPEAPGPQPRASVTVRESATREDEVRETCARIAGDSRSIGVVMRSVDPYDVALFSRFANEFGFAISETVPMPLAGHRFGRAAIQLLRLRDRNFPRADVLEIARSGLKLATAIDCDKADYETRRAMIAGGRSTDLRQRTFRSPVIDDYIVVVEELESLTERIDSSWLPRIADRFGIETGADGAVVETLQTIATMFQRADAWNRPFDAASLIDAIENAEQPRPEARGARPVWLGDVMRLRGRWFDHLFAVRMQDDILPQRRTEDPLLIDSDRRLLGLRQIGDGRDEEQFLFRIMCGAADSVEFSFAASDGFGKALRKSHYLRQLPVAGCALPVERPVSRQWPSVHRQLQLLVRSGTNGVFDGYLRSDVVRERAIGALQSLSPTHLEDFGECPQKFLLKRILGVRDLEDPEMQMQIDHREKGNVDHKILERFYGAMSETSIREAMAALPVLPERMVGTLDRIIDEEFEALAEKIPPYNAPVRRIEHEATRRVLRQFLAIDLADLASESLMPRRFEHRFDPLVIDAGGTSLRVEGKIDRVDEGDGRTRIVDYKSGKALRHVRLGDKIDRGVRLQLALYALAMKPGPAASGPRLAVSAAIKPIAGTTKLSDYSFDLAEKESRLRETLALFVSAIQRGDFPAFPNEKDSDYNACKYCPVNHSCRTRHDAGEKRAVLRAGDPRTLFEEQSA